MDHRLTLEYHYDTLDRYDFSVRLPVADGPVARHEHQVRVTELRAWNVGHCGCDLLGARQVETVERHG